MDILTYDDARARAGRARSHVGVVAGVGARCMAMQLQDAGTGSPLKTTHMQQLLCAAQPQAQTPLPS